MRYVVEVLIDLFECEVVGFKICELNNDCYEYVLVNVNDVEFVFIVLVRVMMIVVMQWKIYCQLIVVSFMGIMYWLKKFVEDVKMVQNLYV